MGNAHRADGAVIDRPDIVAVPFMGIFSSLRAHRERVPDLLPTVN